MTTAGPTPTQRRVLAVLARAESELRSRGNGRMPRSWKGMVLAAVARELGCRRQTAEGHVLRIVSHGYLGREWLAMPNDELLAAVDKFLERASFATGADERRAAELRARLARSRA